MATSGLRAVLNRLSPDERRADISVALYCEAFGTVPPLAEGRTDRDRQPRDQSA